MLRTARLGAIGSWVLWMACSSDPPAEDDETCEVGRSISCACTNGMQGAQRCEEDGALGDCVCNGGSGGSSAPSGGATSGGAAGFGGGAPTGGAQPSGGTAMGGSIATGGTGVGGAATGGVATGGVTTGGATTGGATTGGVGGTNVAGGTGGTSGGGAGGSGGDPDNWVNVTVTYDGSITRQLGRIYTLTPSYSAATGAGKIIYQVEDGYTLITIEVRPASSGGGQEVLLLVSDANRSLPARIQGGYYETAATRPFTHVPLASSCVTFTQLELRFGGVIAGSLDCNLLGGNDTTPVPAMASGSFRGVLPQ